MNEPTERGVQLCVVNSAANGAANGAAKSEKLRFLRHKYSLFFCIILLKQSTYKLGVKV
jgi:hypothetical protein